MPSGLAGREIALSHAGVTGRPGTEPHLAVFSSHQLQTEDAMSVGKSLALAAILSVISIPAMAQAVISEPGYCAFFYPNANCQNKGPGNPYTDGGYYRGGYAYGGMPAAGQTVGVVPPKARSRRAATRMQ
jgi:hypothetical protein